MSDYESSDTEYASPTAPPGQRKVVQPLSQDEIAYLQAMTALEISANFVIRSLMGLRTSNGDQVLQHEKSEFKAKVDSVIAVFIAQVPDGETPRTVADRLAKTVDEFQIARGLRFDLAGGNRTALSKIGKDKKAFMAWKEEENQKTPKNRRDRPVKNKVSPAYRGYEREINIIKPRIENIVGDMTRILERLWHYDYEDDVDDEDDST